MRQPFVVAERLDDGSGDTAPLLLGDAEGSPIAETAIRRQLLDDFYACGIQEDSSYTWDKFFARIQSSKLQYNQEALYRVFLACENSNGAVTARNICDTYCSRVNSLRKSVKAKQAEIKRLERLLGQTTSNVRKAEAEQRSGVTQGAHNHEPQESTLVVQVVAVRDFQDFMLPPATTLFQLHLECNGLSSDTTPQTLKGGDLYWNSMVAFEDVSKDASLRVTLQQLESLESQTVELCDCSVTLEELADQRRHIINRQMWGSVKCEVEINCQWIYNRLALYKSFVREFAAKREAAIRELDRAKTEEHHLTSPFGLMRGKAGLKGMLAGMRDGPQLLSASIDAVLDSIRLSNDVRALQIMTIIYLALSVLSSYARAAFVDMSISSVAFWLCFASNPHRSWTDGAYSKMIWSIVASAVSDAFWFNAYFGRSEDNGLAKPEMSLRTITKIFSLLTFGWKVRCKNTNSTFFVAAGLCPIPVEVFVRPEEECEPNHTAATSAGLLQQQVTDGRVV